MKKIIDNEDFEIFFEGGKYYVKDFAEDKVIQLKPVDGTVESYDYSGKNKHGNNLYFAKDTKTIVTVNVSYDEVNSECDLERTQEDSVSDAFVDDDTPYTRYLMYLLNWIGENKTSVGSSPDSYDEWIKR